MRAGPLVTARGGSGVGADDALVGALDREVDRLGDRERESLAARAARAAGVADAEDVQERRRWPSGCRRPTMSGPAHGVELAIGQETVTLGGRGVVPSVATSTLISSGSWSGAIRRSSCWNSSSHRSEPIGLRAGGGLVRRSSRRLRLGGSARGVASPRRRRVFGLDGIDVVGHDLAVAVERDLVVGRCRRATPSCRRCGRRRRRCRPRPVHAASARRAVC